MKKIVLVLMFIFSILNLNAQKIETLLDSCIAKSVKIYDNIEEVLVFNDSDSIVESSDINFYKLEPINNSLEKPRFFKTYYKDGVVESFEFNDTTKMYYNYKLKVLDEEKFIYLFGYFNYNYIQGVIVVDKERTKLYFICLQDRFNVVYTSQFDRVEYIMKLNDELLPVYKIAFECEKIMYVSRPKEKAKRPNEEYVLIPGICEPKEKASFENLDRICIGIKCLRPFGTVIPGVARSYIPVWLYGNYQYD
jgi:hypothetical protein